MLVLVPKDAELALVDSFLGVLHFCAHTPPEGRSEGSLSSCWSMGHCLARMFEGFFSRVGSRVAK